MPTIQRVGQDNTAGIADAGDNDGVGEHSPVHKARRRLLDDVQAHARELVGAQVIAQVHRAQSTILVAINAGVNPNVAGGRGGAVQMIVAGLGHKERIAPMVVSNSSGVDVSAPIAAISPPQRGLQRGGVAGRNADAHNVADQDGVGQRRSGGAPIDAKPAAIAAGVVGDGGVAQIGAAIHHIHPAPAPAPARLVVGDNVVFQRGVGALVQIDPTAIAIAVPARSVAVDIVAAQRGVVAVIQIDPAAVGPVGRSNRTRGVAADVIVAQRGGVAVGQIDPTAVGLIVSTRGVAIDVIVAQRGGVAVGQIDPTAVGITR